MADKILVSLSAGQVTAALSRRGRLVECASFQNDESGCAAFDEFLAPHPGVPVYFMADVVEEDYRFETLPHAVGADRSELVQRKLKQHYRNTPHVAAWLLGRDRDKRRDDRYLFSALTNPNLVAPWLHAATVRGMPVAGIFLLPIVSAGLIGALRVKATNLLLVSQQSGGLRLTFFRDGQFRLSRLTRGEGGKVMGRARFIADEVSNTRVYLHALRTTRLDEQLTLLLLDRDDTLVEVSAAIARDNPSLECVRVSRRELSSSLGIAESMLELSADAVYLQLLAQRQPPGNLAAAAVTGGFRRLQLRRAIYAAAGAAALAGTAWSGFNVWQTFDAHAQMIAAARRTALLRDQYREVTRQFPAAPASAQSLQRTVEIARQLREGVRTPEMFMRVVSAAVDSAPGIAVSGLVWKHGTGDADASPGARRTEAPAAGAGSARRQSGLVEGEIKPFRGDYRAAVAAINAFTERLSRDPAVAEARIAKLPLNVDPALALAGNTRDSREQGGAAEFKVLVVMKPNL
jgi:uncharacterized protein (DUF1778 family)